jgi:hypothetical protein
VAPRGVGGLLGERGQPLDRRDGIVGESCAAALAGGPHRGPARPQLSQLMAQLAYERACLVGARVLVLDGALERLQLGVRVGQVARVHALLFDACARERLELRANRVELGAQPLLLLGLRACLGQLGRQALVPL